MGKGEFLLLKDKDFEGDGLAYKRFEKSSSFFFFFFFFFTSNIVSYEDLIQINKKINAKQDDSSENPLREIKRNNCSLSPTESS